jgi:hypothetical protein
MTLPSPLENQTIPQRFRQPVNTLPILGTKRSLPALDELLRSSDVGHRLTNSFTSIDTSVSDTMRGSAADPREPDVQETPPRGFWEWARVGRMGLVSRKTDPPGFLRTKAATLAVSDVLQSPRGIERPKSLNDSDRVSSTGTVRRSASVGFVQSRAAKFEGLALSNSALAPALFVPMKRSSDDVRQPSVTPNGTSSATASQTGHARPNDEGNEAPMKAATRKIEDEGDAAVHTAEESRGKDNAPASSTQRNGDQKTAQPNTPKQTVEASADNAAVTPSPQSRKKNVISKKHSTPRAVPKYKIALASHILSPRKSSAT